MRVTACVVSYNTATHLPGLLGSLADQDHGDLEVVVVDNNSHDGSADVARAHAGVRVIANRRNLGYSGAANQGVAAAADGALLLVTPDVRLAPDHVSALVRALEADPGLASVQGRLRRMGPDGTPLTVGGHPVIDSTGHTAHTNRVFRNRGDGEADDGRFSQPAPLFGVTGAAALHRLDALHDVAFEGEVFDADLFAFFEDVDLDWRLKARGWAAGYVPDALGLHERGGEGARRSPLVERLSYRNWFLAVAKNDDPRTWLPHAHLLAATTLLRTADLAVTVPTAFAGALWDLRRLGSTMAKRRHLDAIRTVDAAEIVAEWFEPFDYRRWIAKRIRRGW